MTQPASDASDMSNTSKTPAVNVIELAKATKQKAKASRRPYNPNSWSLLHCYVDAPVQLKGMGGVKSEPLLDLVGGGDVFLANDPTGHNQKDMSGAGELLMDVHKGGLHHAHSITYSSMHQFVIASC